MDVKEFIDAIKQDDQVQKNRTYQAEVSSIDSEGVVWIRLAGSDKETPTQAAASEVKRGDSVNVEWRNNKLYIAGNYSNPSAGVQRIVVIEKVADKADKKATSAEQTANDASETADTANAKATSAKDIADTATINIDDLDLFINGGYTTEVTTDRSGSSAYDKDEITIDKGGFYDQVGGVYGSYEFVYDGSSWKIDGSTVELDTYGIVLTATPESGDTITVNLTEVVGSVSDVNQRVDNLTQVVDENAESAASDIDAVQSGLQASIDAQNEVIESAQSEIDYLTTKTAGMGFTNEYGLVLYGLDATDGSGFKLQLSAEAINFINGALGNNSDILAYISGNILNINNAEIKEQLRFGNFAFIPRSNGNMCLKYLG